MADPHDIPTLLKRIRILEKKLARSEAHRSQREDDRERMARMHLDMLEKVTASEAEARRASLAKSRFLANMSHEIRTPLAGVIGVTDLLLRSGLNDRQLELARTLKDASDLLLDLLNDVLDFSKIEAGELALLDEPFSPREVVRSVVGLFRPIAERRGIQVDARADTLPPLLRGDAGRVRQILTNLVANAVKFTEAGSVTLEAIYQDSALNFVVVDTGIGIPAHLHDAVFDPFRQQDESSTRRFGGTGLGLPISRDLARTMGGDVTLTSAPEQGTRIQATLVLPLCDVADDLQELDDLTMELDGMRVLLAEDSPVNRLVAEKLLAQLGCSVHAVDDGRAAVQAFDQGSYDLVLLDLQMPVMDGFDAARAIRERDARIPIVAVTASVLAGNRQRCEDAGMTGFLSKPFTLTALADLIARLI